MNKILTSLVAAIIISFSVFSNDTDAPTMIGPKVGSALPVTINLIDQTGAVKNITDLHGAKGTVIVFYRSADWCPYCQMQLIDLQLHAESQIKAKGYNLVAISYDDVKTIKRFTEKWSITFPLLSDKGSKLIDALSLRNPAYKEKGRYYGVPYPLVLVIDAKGTVKAKLHEKSYRKRPPVSEILKAL